MVQYHVSILMVLRRRDVDIAFNSNYEYEMCVVLVRHLTLIK